MADFSKVSDVRLIVMYQAVAVAYHNSGEAPQAVKDKAFEHVLNYAAVLLSRGYTRVQLDRFYEQAAQESYPNDEPVYDDVIVMSEVG